MNTARVILLSAALLAVSAIAFAVPDAVAGEVAVGELRLVYDDGVWAAEPLVEAQIVRFTCFSVDCGVLDGLRSDLYAIARPASAAGWRDCEAVQATMLTHGYRDEGAFTFAKVNQAGVEFNVTGVVGICGRTRQPLIIQACGQHDGITYWLTTGFSGCSPEPEMSKLRFDEILAGLRGSTPALP